MTYTSIAISSGHSTKCQGAVGLINEVAEATRVVDQVAKELKDRGVNVKAYHDTISTTQNENLNRIVDWHNAQTRELDISCHFNASKKTANPVGTEVWYASQQALAAQLSAAIAESGLKDRGAKSNGLFFLSHTAMPAVLLEICFVDSEADVKIYRDHFNEICASIADVLGGEDADITPEPEPSQALFYATGKCSYFGGPEDTGVSPEEGLALVSEIGQAPQLFLPSQPHGTTGLARRLNPYVHYVACRWDYAKTPKPSLLEDVALVTATRTGIALKAFPADWGPNENTGRVADLSPSLLDDLGLETDDEVTIVFPYREGES
jgi:N-acetylmuramoyl-L-alanine amidase